MFAIETEAPSSICFGFLDEKFDEHSIRKSPCPNINKLYGYCPLLGSVIGISNIFAAIFGMRRNDIENVVVLNPLQRALIGLRGGVELLSLGLVWLPVDLLATVIQEVVSRRQEKRHHN